MNPAHQPSGRAPLPHAGDLLSDPAHGGPLDGASAIAEARGEDRLVRIGLWRAGGRIVRAGFQATVCASLVAYAEAACRALEAGVTELPAAALRERVRGIHPGHRHRAGLVAAAVRAALSPPSPKEPPA